MQLWTETAASTVWSSDSMDWASFVQVRRRALGRWQVDEPAARAIFSIRRCMGEAMREHWCGGTGTTSCTQRLQIHVLQLASSDSLLALWMDENRKLHCCTTFPTRFAAQGLRTSVHFEMKPRLHHLKQDIFRSLHEDTYTYFPAILVERRVDLQPLQSLSGTIMPWIPFLGFKGFCNLSQPNLVCQGRSSHCSRQNYTVVFFS